METNDALWRRRIRCFLGSKPVVPAMEHSGGGSIVNIASIAGLKGSPGSFACAATKWALQGQVGSDLGGRKIQVNSVHPGPSRQNDGRPTPGCSGLKDAVRHTHMAR